MGCTVCGMPPDETLVVCRAREPRDKPSRDGETLQIAAGRGECVDGFGGEI